MPAAGRPLATKAGVPLHPRRVSCHQLRASQEPAGAYRVRGLSTPAAASI
jgi:hypothetical protein